MEQITLQILLTAGGVLATIAGAFAVVRHQVGALETKLKEKSHEIDVVKEQFHQYQLQAVKEFVSVTSFAKIEDAFAQLNARIDDLHRSFSARAPARRKT